MSRLLLATIEIVVEQVELVVEQDELVVEQYVEHVVVLVQIDYYYCHYYLHLLILQFFKFSVYNIKPFIYS